MASLAKESVVEYQQQMQVAISIITQHQTYFNGCNFSIF
jgi:hypothetical protein